MFLSRNFIVIEMVAGDNTKGGERCVASTLSERWHTTSGRFDPDVNARLALLCKNTSVGSTPSKRACSGSPLEAYPHPPAQATPL
ncbi:hypothetical protein [Mycoavidus sp. SF9855]|uniref:hypothetical protein n=1 Tax=Mycoavidus sp. SF9855 TaxID=2968475 RepID=UPI00211CC2A8|nr:hypothetical protein [Mycoavidus sp. SF9855]UUM21402.1 hypothetical protein NQD60_08225 [Mycoavidus sp. SF9855]